MHPTGHNDDAADYGDELPELPIPRPGERTPSAREDAAPAAPGIGGGASLTSVGDEGSAEQAATPAGASADARLSWEIASRLVAGMLANPAQAHASVKDAMGLFDKFVNELHAYTRLTTGLDAVQASEQRRREHNAYFYGGVERSDAKAPPTAATPQPKPTLKPQPTQPRPMGDYRAIPPGARYVPGSMAGAPPPPVDEATDGDERAA
jgi:hypothetical protein